MNVRDATEADLPAIVRLLADDGLGRGRERYETPLPACYGEALRALQRQAGNRFLVAVEEGEVMGCLQLTLIAGLSRQGMLRAQIEAVRVDRRWRGRGLGEAFFRHAIELARQAGCGLVQLTTDKGRAEAHRFYGRLGFVASHEGMKLDLTRDLAFGDTNV